MALGGVKIPVYESGEGEPRHSDCNSSQQCSSNKLGNGERDILLPKHPLLDSKCSMGAVINPRLYTVSIVSFYRWKLDMK